MAYSESLSQSAFYRYLIPALFIFLSFNGCSQSSVSGHIVLSDVDFKPVVYLLEPTGFSSLVSSYECKVVDSAEINEAGDFRFDKFSAPEKEGIFLLAIQKKGEKYLNRLENNHPDSGNYIPFLLKKGYPVEIRSESGAFLRNGQIASTLEGNRDILVLIANRSRLFKQFLSDQAEVNEENLLENEKSLYNFQHQLVESVMGSQDLYVLALALQWAGTKGDYERIPELVKATCKGMSAIEPEHMWTQQVCKKSGGLPLTPGDTFPDFMMPMTDGDTISLRSLLGSQLTIIDIWASWCAPCRKENRNTLVPLWDNFHDSGLQIIGYALESERVVWLNAIKRDGADRWSHASHMEGDTSPFLDLLKITTIPANYILDRNGVILAKNLHGKELEEWVTGKLGKE